MGAGVSRLLSHEQPLPSRGRDAGSQSESCDAVGESDVCLHRESAASRGDHLFQSRFKSALVEGELYLDRRTRYIHMNPVRAGLASYAHRRIGDRLRKSRPLAARLKELEALVVEGTSVKATSTSSHKFCP